ncbi:MAG: hypothetical protein ACR2MT_03020 [Aurantibacter sp.]
MKKVCMGLLMIGMSNLGLAQYAPQAFSNPFHNSIRSIDADVDYLDEVQGSTTPNQVKLIEKEVSDWVPSESSKFNPQREQFFGATFKTANGYIAADYDQNGNIISTEERFENVALPRAIAGEIVKQYPGWIFAQTKFILKYRKGQTSKKLFKVVIKKGNQKKRLRIYA